MVLLVIVGWLDTGSPMFVQMRVGRDKTLFRMYKFRTMAIGSRTVDSHLASELDITLSGRFLRRMKLDELPQLYNVLIGDMSIVGPRPCLPTQLCLINERSIRGVFDVRPGITGLAQIMGVDMSTPRKLAAIDMIFVKKFNVCSYLRCLIKTLVGNGRGDAIRN